MEHKEQQVVMVHRELLILGHKEQLVRKELRGNKETHLHMMILRAENWRI
jgi:hypothetical protein